MFNDIKKDLFLDFVAQMPGLNCVKDCTSKYYMMSSQVCDITGIKSTDASFGIRDHDLPSLSRHSADLYVAQDKQVITAKKKMLTVDINQHLGQFYGLLTSRLPLIDQTTQQISGIYTQCTDITSSMLFSNFIMLEQANINTKNQSNNCISYILDETFAPFKLTERQHETLFFTIRGKSAKDIAKILNISNRTVESAQAELKRKLDCSSKAQLIDKAIDAGYLFYVPNRILHSKLGDLSQK